MKLQLAPMLLIAALAIHGPVEAQDAAVGERTARHQCATCHSFNEGGANRVGPALWAITQRAPGTAPGYRYSPAFLAAARKGFNWNDDNLSEYLSNPSAFVQYMTGDGNARSAKSMRLRAEQQRRDVIAYLRLLR
jgi:cytochrome c